MKLDTCNGCVYLSGLITANGIFAQCGDGVWQEERYIALGYDITRPSRCTNKTLRIAEQQLTTHKDMSFLKTLWNKFIGKNINRLTRR